MTEIEFFSSSDGQEVMVQRNGQCLPLIKSDTDLIHFLYQNIQENYPDAFSALMEIYAGVAWYKFLVVRRFGKCNFSVYDNKPDVRHDGLFNIEFVQCPLRGECKWEHTICLPKFNTSLSDREMQVLKLICNNLEDSQIADLLFISIHTASNHRKNILRKTNAINKLGILKYAQENGII